MSSKEAMEKKKKNKIGSKTNEQKKRRDGRKRDEVPEERFGNMYNDPRFLPIDPRTSIVDKRFSSMLDPSFVMLQTTRNAKGQKTEHYIKNQLKNIYKFEKNKQSKIVDELRREAENQDNLDSEEEKDDDDDDVVLTRESLGLGMSGDINNEKRDQEEEEEEEELKQKEYTFDDFLGSLKDRPEFQNDDDDDDDKNKDDIHDFSDSDEDKVIDEDYNEEAIKEAAEILQNDTWKKIVEDAERIQDGDETNRIAIMNFDWRIIDSTDLYVILSSLCPPGGRVKSVMIYLSDFGKQKLEEEKAKGPNVWFDTQEEYEAYVKNEREFREGHERKKLSKFYTKDGKEKSFDERKFEYKMKLGKGEVLDPLKVRDYELNKLRYYFAVVECDSVTTAVSLYDECDGWEIESSGVCLDLRFIPDDVSFEERQILNMCDKQPIHYKPKKNLFSQQLQNTDVDLTWDVDDPDREVLKSRDFSQLSEADLMKYIASSSSSESSDSESEVKTKRKKKKRASKEEKRIKAEDPQVDDDEENKEMEEATKPNKIKKKKKKTKKKMENQKYKKLLELAQAREDSLVNDESILPETVEMTFDDEIKEKGEEIVRKHQAKEKQENDGWWESLERKRKEKKKEKKKARKEQFNAAKNESDEEDKPEREAQQRAKLEMLMTEYKESEIEGVSAFNVKKDIDREKSRRKTDKQSHIRQTDQFEIDMKDQRFIPTLLENPDFALDQTHHRFKKTKNMQQILREKVKKKGVTVVDSTNAVKRKPSDGDIDEPAKSKKQRTN